MIPNKLRNPQTSMSISSLTSSMADGGSIGISRASQRYAGLKGNSSTFLFSISDKSFKDV